MLEVDKFFGEYLNDKFEAHGITIVNSNVGKNNGFKHFLMIPPDLIKENKLTQFEWTLVLANGSIKVEDVSKLLLEFNSNSNMELIKFKNKTLYLDIIDIQFNEFGTRGERIYRISVNLLIK